MKFLLDSPQLRRPRLQIKMTYGDIVRDIVDLSGSDDNSLESGSFQDDYPSPAGFARQSLRSIVLGAEMDFRCPESL